MATDIIRSKRSKGKDPIGFECLSDIQTKSIDWIWRGVLARGKVTILTGVAGLGKSLLSLDIAAKITRGGQLPGGTKAPSGRVLLLCAEDDFGDTVKPRLEAAGADTSMIVRPDAHIDLASDADALVGAGDVALIVIDPITSYLDNVNIDRAGEVRPAMEALASVAARMNAAVLAITHPSKVTGRAAVHAAVGSQAFVAVARLAWQLSSDPESSDTALLLPVKANICKGADGQKLRIASQGEHPRIEWVGTTSLKADDIQLPAAARLKQMAEQAVLDCVGDGLPEVELVKQACDLLNTRGVSQDTQRAVKQAVKDKTKASKQGMQGGWLRVAIA